MANIRDLWGPLGIGFCRCLQNERLAGVRIFKVPQKRRDVRCEGFGGLGFEGFWGLAVGGFGAVGFRVWHWREKIAWDRLAEIPRLWVGDETFTD